MCIDLPSVLESEGFCTVDRCLDSQTIQMLTTSFENLDEGNDGVTERESSARKKRGVIFARRNLLSSPCVQRFIASEPVVPLVNQISTGSIAIRAILFDKTGEANWTVPWHQDRSIAVAEKINVPGFGPWSEKAGVAHVQPSVSLLKKMFTLRFSLDECGPDNGPLRVIPATHRRILAPAETDIAVRDGVESKCMTSAGGVVIMRPLLLHASSPATRAGHRRILHVEFGPPALPDGLRWAMT
jgi:ectoine hydroxylase-related dioxygenase (phytanoyl-CoA dioxygenase family)